MPDSTAHSPRSVPEIVLGFAVLALVLGPVGTAVFILGFGQGDSPCILCWAQRTAMVLVAVNGLFILRYGPRSRYVGLAMLIATFGVYMGIRHSALHLARDIGQGFSLSILGAHTYTWSFFIFWATLVLVGALVMGLGDGALRHTIRDLRRIERVTAWLLLAVVAANALQALASTGPPPYVGQSDPVRFSWNPRHDTDAIDVFLRGPNKPPGAIVIAVNWYDNPWFPEVLRKEMEHSKATDYDEYLHVWEGNCISALDGAVYAINNAVLFSIAK